MPYVYLYALFYLVVPASVHVKAQSPLLLLEGEKFSATCDFDGFPIPVVTWNFKSQQLQNGLNGVGIHHVPFMPIVLLDIQQVSVSDAGLYTCIGTNNVTRLGMQTAKSSIQLTVEGRACNTVILN